MRDRLVELLGKELMDYASWQTEMALAGNYNMPSVEEVIADKILKDGWFRPPCKVGDTVYKIEKFCEKNTGFKEFYRPSVEFEENCPYLEPQSWQDDCDKCKAVKDYDEACYCTLNLKIFCDTCKKRLAIQKEKFTFGMMTQVFNTPMFDENTSAEDILYITREEAEEALSKLQASYEQVKGGAE